MSTEPELLEDEETEPEIRFTCDWCGDDVMEDDDDHGMGTGEGDMICQHCAELEAGYCGFTSEYWHHDRLVWLVDTDEQVNIEYAERYFHCVDGDWYSEPQDEAGALLDYDADVLDHCSLGAGSIKRGVLYFGVEVEMEVRSGSSVDRVVDSLTGDESEPVGDGFILKSDGSLTNGVEMVTIPMILADHQEGFWAARMGKVSKYARSGDVVTTCGIHVHMSRSAITPLTLGKALVFINSNVNDAKICAIAQRTPTGYCRKTVKKIADGLDRCSYKYERLHVSDKTIECRIFRGNLRPERILKNIEFCDAMLSFCRVTSIRNIESWPLFCQHVTRHRKQWPNLFAFMCDHSLIQDNRLCA